MTALHAFGDDALGTHDGLALAALVRDRRLGRREVLEAALARAEAVAALNAVEVLDPRGLDTPPRSGPFSGVPTFVKDNTDVIGLPTGQGSEAFTPRPAKHDAALTQTVRDLGFAILGKSRMPEFGFNATTEFMTGEPVRNPWDTGRSAGASSGGQPPWSRRASSRSRTPTTAAARSGSPPPAAAWSGSRPPAAGTGPVPSSG